MFASWTFRYQVITKEFSCFSTHWFVFIVRNFLKNIFDCLMVKLFIELMVDFADCTIFTFPLRRRGRKVLVFISCFNYIFNMISFLPFHSGLIGGYWRYIVVFFIFYFNDFWDVRAFSMLFFSIQYCRFFWILPFKVCNDFIILINIPVWYGYIFVFVFLFFLKII